MHFFTTLKNGLKVILIPYKVDTVTCCLRGFAGSNYEQPQEIGAAHFLEHMITYGDEKYGSDFRNIITKTGGRITATTSRDDVAFLTKTTRDSYIKGIEYLGKLFNTKNLNSDYFGQNLMAISQEILLNEENPQRNIGRISYKILYPNQRFSTYNTGKIQDIKKLDVNKLTKFKDKHYSPKNFIISICGDIKTSQSLEAVNEFFGSSRDTAGNKDLMHKPNYEKAFLTKFIPSLKQTHIKVDYHGFKTNESQKYSAVICANIFNNLLKHNILNSERLGPYICDTASFSSNSYGLWGTYISLAHDQVGEFFKVYAQTKNQILCRNYNNNLIKNAKTKINADFIFQLEKTSLRADYYSELYLYKNISKSHQEELDHINGTTILEINNNFINILSQHPKITCISSKISNSLLQDLWEKYN